MFAGKFHIFHNDDGEILTFCNSRILFTLSPVKSFTYSFVKLPDKSQFELFKFLSDEKVSLDVGKLIQQMRMEKKLTQKDLATVR